MEDRFFLVPCAGVPAALSTMYASASAEGNYRYGGGGTVVMPSAAIVGLRLSGSKKLCREESPPYSAHLIEQIENILIDSLLHGYSKLHIGFAKEG